MAIERLTPKTSDWKKYSARHIQLYEYFKDFYKGKVVLDLACGVGYGSDIINCSGAKEVVGLDISSEAISFAKNNYSNPSIHFYEMDYQKVLSLGRKFDLIISIETIEHIHDQSNFVTKMREVLNENGLLICTTPNKLLYTGRGIPNEFHVNELTIQEFRALYQPHLTIVSEFCQRPSVSYKRYVTLRKNIQEVMWSLNSTPYQRLKNFIKKIIGKKTLTLDWETDIANEDFVIEQFDSGADDADVFILVGKPR